MKQLRIPDFVGNLFRDLRDRRLLLPAIALILGLFAVPIVLTSHSSTNATPGQVVSGLDAKADQVVPAVVTQQRGATKYQERLNQLQSKNPFRQQYTDTPESAKLSVASTTTDSPTSSSTGDTGSTTSSTSSSSTTPTVSSGGTTSSGSMPPPSTSSSGGTSSSGSNSAAPHHHTNPGFRYYAWRVSVKVGEAGHLNERPEVQRLALLPSEHRPVLTFLGANEKGSKAVFLVSSDVDSVSGDGHCAPNHSSCQYVVMKPGDKANFHYAPNNTRYNLVLVDIHPVDVTDKLPKPKKAPAEAQPQQKMPILGDG